MSAVRFTKPINRLSWRAGFKGVTRAEAVNRAEANLESVRPTLIKDIDDDLCALNTVFSNTAENAVPPIAELYRISGAIVAIAGLFGLDGLGKAAFSLCELLSEFEASGCWWADPVRVHIDAMRVLRRLDHSDHEKEIQLILRDISGLLNHFRCNRIILSL